MDYKIDKKTRETLLEALGRAKAFTQKLKENREQRLWKNSKSSTQPLGGY